MFAVLSINVMLFEVTLDVVTSKNLLESFLKDFLDLPEDYYEIGAYVEYQDFVKRCLREREEKERGRAQ